MEADSADRTVVRAAVAADLDAVAALLVELYRCEVPGMLRGSRGAQLRLMRGLVAATEPRLRYVAERRGAVVGMGSMATAELPRPSMPPLVVLRASVALGPVSGVTQIVGAVRGSLSIAGVPSAEECQLHSVVVDSGCRGCGIGRRLVQRLEEEAATLEKTRVALQVVSTNCDALRFYQSVGYRVHPQGQRRLRHMVAYPTIGMSKKLDGT